MWNFPCETIESASADRRKYPFNFLNLLFIMKCSVFVVAVALVMASCSQDETTGINKGSTIRFRTSVERTTRGVQTTLADLGEFKVTAVGTAPTISPTSGSPPPTTVRRGRRRKSIIGRRTISTSVPMRRSRSPESLSPPMRGRSKISFRRRRLRTSRIC